MNSYSTASIGIKMITGNPSAPDLMPALRVTKHTIRHSDGDDKDAGLGQKPVGAGLQHWEDPSLEW